jgi:hypothetical protein
MARPEPFILNLRAVQMPPPPAQFTANDKMNIDTLCQNQLIVKDALEKQAL